MSPEASGTPDDVRLFQEGLELLKTRRIDEAVERFRAAATSGEDRPMEHYALGVALYRKGELTEAAAELRRFLAMSPAETRYVHKVRAILPVIEERLNAEQTGTDQVQGEAADSLGACAPYREGIDAYLRGDYEEAVECFGEASEILPDNPHVWNNLGLACLGRGDHERALEHFGRALEAEPGFAEAHNNLGLAWRDYGIARAREAFERAIESDPDCFDALMNLGSLCYHEGDLPRARHYWQRAHRLRPDDPAARRNLRLFR